MGFEIMRWDRCIRNVWRFSFSFKEVKSKLFWKVSHDLSAQRTKSTRILAAVACWNFQLTHKRLIVKNFDESCGCEKIMLRHCFWHSLKVPRWDGHSQKVSYPVNIHKSWMNPAQSCIAGSVDQTEARICPQFSFSRPKSASTTFKAWGALNSISNIALIDSIGQLHMYHISTKLLLKV